MSGSFAQWAAEASAGFQEGVGDVARNAYADISDTYNQTFLQGGTLPDTPMTADYLTTGPELETVQSYQSALLQHGVSAGLEAEADHWREQELSQMPEPEEPDIGAPDIDAPDIDAPDIGPG
jgi:hypothetical protein